MATNKFAGQSYERNTVHYLEATVSQADSTSGTAVSLGWLPPKACVIGGGAVVQTAFDSGTSDLLDMGFRNAVDGTADDTNEYMTAVSIASVGYKETDEMATAGDLYTDEGAEVVATWTGAGTAATAGEAHCFVRYIIVER